MYSFFIDTIVIVFLGYAVSYPFLLWITPIKEIDASFYRFNLGLCCIIGALGVIGFIGLESNVISKFFIWLWLGLILIITSYYWDNKNKNNFILSLVSVVGCFAFYQIIIQISPKSDSLLLFFITFFPFFSCNFTDPHAHMMHANTCTHTHNKMRIVLIIRYIP